MTQVPRRLIAMMNRHLLVEMMASSYALARNIDPNEAADRLDEAMRQIKLADGLQRGAWMGLMRLKPDLDEAALMERVQKKLSKNKRWQPIKAAAREDGAFAAVILLIDVGAGVAAGEAWDMLESSEGAKFLEKGFALIGAHLAKELLR